MRAGTLEVGDDLVALSDEIDDLHAEVWERVPERADPTTRDLPELALRHRVENLPARSFVSRWAGDSGLGGEA
jgi:hypothetical protein